MRWLWWRDTRGDVDGVVGYQQRRLLWTWDREAMACSSKAIQVRTAAVGLGGGFRGQVGIAAGGGGMLAGVLRFMKAGGGLRTVGYDTTWHATLHRCKGLDEGVA